MSSNSGKGRSSSQENGKLIDSNKVNSLEFPEELKANLEKLRALSKDDLTENAMLRSRIDQQAELICILKQRADEALRKTMSMEKEIEELRKSRDETLCAMHNESRKYSVLEKRFFVLNSNHEELIAFKDEYKEHNARLRGENERLRKENEELFVKTVKDRDGQIRELKNELRQLQSKCSLEEKRRREASESLTIMEEKSKEENEKLQEQIAVLEEKMEANRSEAETGLQQSKDEAREARTQLTLLQRERDDFAQLALDRGKSIQEKQKEIESLLNKLTEAERVMREKEDKFAMDQENVSVNAQVRKLRKQLEEADKTHKDSMNEYEAYKKHTATLLAKEKELNSKLRVLIG